MTSDTTSDQDGTVPTDKGATEDAPAPAKPSQPVAPGRVQPVDQAAQEDAAKDRAEGGGYN